MPGSGAYSASKAAAITYLESLRVELRGTGVAVVTICPGYIATPMTAGNPYRMPFLTAPDEAARTMVARAIARRRRFYVLPWPMAMAGGRAEARAAPALRPHRREPRRKPRRED